jgi:hypothetical protein
VLQAEPSALGISQYAVSLSQAEETIFVHHERNIV